MTFAERLRELREERNITQKELGSHLGISPRMVSFYESGAHFPRDAKMLIDIAAFFGVTVDYLLGCSQLREEGTLKKLCAEFSVLPPAERKSPGTSVPGLLFCRAFAWGLGRGLLGKSEE